MTTKNIVIAVIIIIVLVLIGWFIWGNGSSMWMAGSNATTTPVAQTTTTTGTQASSGFKSINDVVAQGGNYQCTIDITDSGNHTTGTVYGTAGKTRLDLTVVAENGTSVITHIIRSGTTSYTWVDGQQTGVKSTFSQGSSVVPQPNGGFSTSTASTQFSSNCYPNVPTASNFVPPTGISFIAR